MSSLNERLDAIKAKIQSDEYLDGKGLSNELNITVFCYDPKEEMTIRHFLSQIKSEKLECNIFEFDLYELFLDILKEKRILDRIEQLEEKRGKAFIRKQLANGCDAKVFAQKIASIGYQRGDVVILSGVGKIFPFMRVHALLEALQPLLTSVPMLVFYPGEYTGDQLRLFNILKPNNYYRPFKAD